MQSNLLVSSGLLLKKLRLKHGFSQQYVASYLNMSRNAYAKWESGKTDIVLYKLFKLLHVYEISTSDFFRKISSAESE
jgi:transcriptional regulator with XRE-family HTH domain